MIDIRLVLIKVSVSGPDAWGGILRDVMECALFESPKFCLVIPMRWPHADCVSKPRPKKPEAR